MAWWEHLGRGKRSRRGSRPRCVLLVDGSREEVADRLTRLAKPLEVVVSSDDKWMPYGKPVLQVNGKWDDDPAKEVELDKPNNLVSCDVQKQLRDWWLKVPGRRTPNWDIASTCKIEGRQGLLLVEAKAHKTELIPSEKSGSKPPNSCQIKWAIGQACTELQSVIGGHWAISRDHHYELSNRFAWSWKLASLGIPVVLLYLGFLNAEDMRRGMSINDSLFESKSDWEKVLKGHSHSIVPETCWDQRWDFRGVPFYPIIRVCDQSFDPTK